MNNQQLYRYRVLRILGAFAMVFALTSCSKNPEPSEHQIVEDLTVEEFETLISETVDLQLVDVRTQDEYAEGHLEGAILMNAYESTFESNLSSLDREKPVAVYCKSGNRSSGARDILTDLDFQEIYNLEEGITAWIDAGKPVVQ